MQKKLLDSHLGWEWADPALALDLVPLSERLILEGMSRPILKYLVAS
jgi:hypothetical protein